MRKFQGSLLRGKNLKADPYISYLLNQIGNEYAVKS